MKRKRPDNAQSGSDSEDRSDDQKPIVPGPSKKIHRHSVGGLPEVENVHVSERPDASSDSQGSIVDEAVMASRTTASFPKSMAEIISDLETRHRKELARRDKEYVAMQIDLDQQRSARVALERRHKAGLVALANGHAREMEKAALIAAKRSGMEWDLREQRAKVRRDRELGEKKATEARIEEAKDQRRNELLVVLLEHNRGIHSLEIRQKDGTLAFTKTEEVTSKQQCLEGLAAIWSTNSKWLSCILPHELMEDCDIALQFVVDVVAARVFLLTLQCWNASAQEVLQTGWSWTVLHRLNCGLVPYVVDTPLSTLSVAVDAICDMLQKAVMALQNVVKQDVTSSAGGMYSAACQTMGDTSTQGLHQTSDFGYPMQQGFNSTLPSLGFTEASPPLTLHSTNSTYAEEDSFEAEIRRLSHLPDAAPMRSTSYVHGLDLPTSATNTSTAKPCYNMANSGFCKFGDSCKFSHDVATGQHNPVGDTYSDVQAASARFDKWVTMPCNYIKKFGSCRKANCPFMHPPGTHVSNDSTDPMIFENQQSQPPLQPDRQCRNEQNNGSCLRPNCRWEHQFPYGPDNSSLQLTQGAANNSNDSFHNQDSSHSSKQCWNERDKGRCIKPNCQFAHQKPHRPTGGDNNKHTP